jgi:hypothetical protein
VLKEPLNHPVVWMEFGPVIALADTVALKMGALHDRVMPRDVLDVHGAAAYFTNAELIAACRGGARRGLQPLRCLAGSARSQGWSGRAADGEPSGLGQQADHPAELRTGQVLVECR